MPVFHDILMQLVSATLLLCQLLSKVTVASWSFTSNVLRVPPCWWTTHF